MEKYSRVLVIIFFLCLINLGLTTYAISKINSANQKTVATTASTVKESPQPTVKPGTNVTTDNDIKSDLTLIKAEIRALREILGTTKSFEELSTLIKSLEGTNQP